MLAVIVVAILALYAWRVHAKRFVIYSRDPADLEPYLTRFKLIRTPWFRVFLHHIHRPDPGRDLHNHPWTRACAFILSGGYTETVRFASRGGMWGGVLYLGPVCAYAHRAGHLSRAAFRANAYHRIESVSPGTWTLFFAGVRDREWGFWTDRHVPWRTYLGLPPDTQLED